MRDQVDDGDVEATPVRYHQETVVRRHGQVLRYGADRIDTVDRERRGVYAVDETVLSLVLPAAVAAGLRVVSRTVHAVVRHEGERSVRREGRLYWCSPVDISGGFIPELPQVDGIVDGLDDALGVVED